VPDSYRISSELFWDVRSVIVSFGPPRNLRISLKSGLGSRHRTLYAADDYHQDASHTATNHIADQSPDVHPASRLS